MRICVDATSLLLRSAGVKNYIYHWVRAMQRHGPHAITAFPFLGGVGELDHERSVVDPWGTLPRIAALHAANVLGSHAMDLFTRGADVFHASNQIHHAPRGKRLTATLYDMTCLLMPHNHTAGNVRAERRYAERILQKANGLIAISNHTKQDAIELLRIDPAKVEVIYPGVPERFFDVAAPERDRVRLTLTLLKPYVLFVGTIEPRKNLDLLLDAWLSLPLDVREEFDLVIAGPEGWAPGATLQRLKTAPAGIRYLGYVAERDLPPLTAASTAFAYPSLYEGFGFPVAQSLAAGVPGITSNVSSLPEVARDAALLVDPRSVTEIRDALLKLLSSPAEREAMGVRGRQIASEYRWETAARKSGEFFSKLA